MDRQEGLATNKTPLFTGENYAYWSVTMRCHLMSLGWKVWEATENDLKIGNQYPMETVELGEYEGNSKALNTILSGLTNSVFSKVMQCTSAKQAWDKLKIIYEGESKVKESKLQTYKGKFESIKMKEEENVGEYLLHLDEVVNAIIGLGRKLKEK